MDAIMERFFAEQQTVIDWGALRAIDQEIAGIANIIDAKSWRPGWTPSNSAAHQRLRARLVGLEAERDRVLSAATSRLVL